MRRLALVAAVAAAACGGPPSLGSTSSEIVVSPAIYDFGAVEVGQTSTPRTFIVSAASGEFDNLLAVTAACPDFAIDTSGLFFPAEVSRDCSGGGLPARGACINVTARFAVAFTPSFAGPESCQVDVEMETAGVIPLTLSGTGTAPPIGQQLIAPAGGSLDFGDVVVGSTSAALPVTLRSIGSGDLDLTGFSIDATDPGAFAFTEAGADPLPPGQDYQWDVTCHPTGPGPITGTITITSDAPTSPVSFPIACNGIQSDLVVDRSPVRFDETLVGGSATITVTLSNAGSAPLGLTGASVTGAGFTTTQPGAMGLAPGESTTVDVTFTPAAGDAGTDVHGTLDLSFDTGSRSIDLIGPARDARLNVTPGGTIDLGTICAGASRDQLLVAVNPGSGATSLADATVTGPGFTLGLIAPTTLPAPLAAHGGSSASLRVTGAPPLGDVTGELTLTAAIPGAAPTVIPLRARGQAGGIGASPELVDFGGVVVGEPSGGRSVRLSNCDAAPLEVTAAMVTGTSAAEFVAVAAGQTLPTTLASGDSLVFVVELRPTSAGDKAAALTITHAGGTTTVPLTGIGVGAETGGDGRGSYYACRAGGDARGGALVMLGLAAALARRRKRR